MKKLLNRLLLLLILIFNINISAQIVVNEGFEGSNLMGPGWSSVVSPSTTGSLKPTHQNWGTLNCAGVQVGSISLGDSTPFMSIIYSSSNSNGTVIDYSFKYSARNYSSGLIKGNIVVDYSLDNGSTWIQLGNIINIDSTNDTIPCTLVAGTIPAGVVPLGSSFKFRITANRVDLGNFALGLDDISLSQDVACPGCIVMTCPNVTMPATDAANLTLTPTISWNSVSGATGYRLSVGTTLGGNDVVNNMDMGSLLSYTFPSSTLNLGTAYYYFVNAYQVANNTSTSCSPRKFVTQFPPPANDNCVNATPLTVNGDMNCTMSSFGNTIGATSSGIPSTCFGNTDDDVWFSFVAVATSHTVSISNIVNTGSMAGSQYLSFQIMKGGCGALTELLCSEWNFASLTNLTPGEKYYIRVYTTGSGMGSAASFKLCVGTHTSPPNDECANAISLSVNPNLNCGIVTSGTTLSATYSGMLISPCTGSPDDDVWYKFTATANTHALWLKNTVALSPYFSPKLYAQVFKGSCGSLVSTICITANDIATVMSGLNLGETYYVRVYSYGSTTPTILHAYTFDICIGTIVVPTPVNDDFVNATSLPVNSDKNCAFTTSGTTYGASESGLSMITPCQGGVASDVWFKFTATKTLHTVDFKNITSVGATHTNYFYAAVFSGGSGSLVSIKCIYININITGGGSSLSPQNLIGLTPGETYYIRVYASTANMGHNFNVCIGTPNAPANDYCSNAIVVPVNPGTTCNLTVPGTTYDASESNPSLLGCDTTSNTFIDDDIWYKFTATQNVHGISLKNLTSVGNNPSEVWIKIYKGSDCSGLVDFECTRQEMYNYDSIFGYVNSTWFVPGETYYIRIYTERNGPSFAYTFDLCITSPLTNTICNNPISLAVADSFDAGAVTASNVGGIRSSPTCSGYGSFYAWFKAIVPASGSMIIETAPVAGSPFVDSVITNSGSCGSTISFCNDNISPTNLFSRVILTGRVPGETIRFAVASSGSVIPYNGIPNPKAGEFKISVYDPGNLATNEVEVKDNNINVHPNPFTDVLNISKADLVKSVSVSDVSGRLVKTIETPSSALHLGDLKQGLYFITLNMKDGSRQMIKAIKK